jgi:hypothetical protein
VGLGLAVGAAERWLHDKEMVQEEEELVTVRGIAGTGRDLPAMRSGAAKGKRCVAVLGWGGVFCWLLDLPEDFRSLQK